MKSKVYLIKVEDGISIKKQAEAMKKLYEFSKAGEVISPKDFVAIKIHVGEKGNTTYVKPGLIKTIVEQVKKRDAIPFLTETATLYKGERENAVKHLLHAHRHGFGIENVGAPFIMADGLLGNAEGRVEIEGELHKSVNISRDILNTDVIIAVSHPTGHMVTGIGAAIKNLGMGLASKKGKRKQHSAMKPSIKDNCVFCKKCIDWCPEDAIIEKNKKASIVKTKCIGCGECLAVCRYDAVSFDWGAEAGFTQKSMVEHAMAAVKGKKCFYFNVMIDMTKDCDCLWEKQEKMIPDIGILASSDPVAIDMATLALTAEYHGKNIAQMSYEKKDAMIQINHGHKVGLGSKEYELITVGARHASPGV